MRVAGEPEPRDSTCQTALGDSPARIESDRVDIPLFSLSALS